MKVFVVLALALACVSAATVPETAVFPKDLKADKVIEGRITNGYEAYPGLFAYQVGLTLSLGQYGSMWCGGSLIGKEWVLTAAHCTDRVLSAVVYLGSTERAVAQLTINVDNSAFIQHAGYNPITLNNDISLIRIPEVTYTDDIQPIKLPAISASYSDYVNTWATASGWGLDENNASVSILKYAQFLVISNAECAKTYGSMITNNILCVATPSGTSTCSGDSGGPLVSDFSRELIGVTSFVSRAGCQYGAAAGFARVTTYLQWIQAYTGISY